MSNKTSLAFDELPRGNGGIGATEQIARVLDESGIDVPSKLYDEALAFARDGRLATATARLRMLLVLDPSDGNAALLLGKVLAARDKWQESLTQLDAATAKGARLPQGLREEVEGKLRQQVQNVESQRTRLVDRERGELRTLRNEAKNLRSENAALEQQAFDLARRAKLWSSATALVAGSSAALLLAALVFGGGEDTEILEEEEVASANFSSSTMAETESTSSSSIPTSGTETPSPEPKSTYTNGVAATHTVQKGENLGQIARKFYGKSSQWQPILDANEPILHGNVKALRPGMVLNIPTPQQN
jgi:nucleoid-associated protein YgaU